ncbi:beta-lactamase/transpeptidase-like protein [Gonapodya prolifera JEL478]|uniref:Beta-lactamase/transpeptidase-like protein n=1 Tax=Gonapodya prolifera (strain JEL478) TaxID=1344416 RepID=A0A139A8E2_GONPJ|nr:beta-lactamase/transpeptidase-like protein [Gonapodya prolifera JEL478]|eukprot:KXS12969.1 beta-lactamase/transpeptidase-like protein [Gonapodya prolifera JEL478]
MSIISHSPIHLPRDPKNPLSILTADDGDSLPSPPPNPITGGRPFRCWAKEGTGVKGYTPEERRRFQAAWKKRAWNFTRTSFYTHNNMSEFFPVAQVSRGLSAPLKLPIALEIGANLGQIIRHTIPDKALGINSEADRATASAEARWLSGREVTLNEYIEKTDVHSFIVLHKGRIVFERYSRMQPSDKHLWWSVSKTLCGFAVALLEHRGLVDVYRSVAQYVPRFKGTDWERVRLIDLLHMASGMEGREHDDGGDENSNPKKTYFQYLATFEGIFETKAQRTNNMSTLEYLATLKRQKTPGTAYEYSDVDTDVLSLVVESVSGLPCATFISREVWSKLGADSDGHMLITGDGSGAVWSAAGMCSTLRDLARWGLAWTPSGASLGVVPPDVVAKVQAPWRPQIFDRGWIGPHLLRPGFSDGHRISHNAYQWDCVFDDGSFYKGGARDQGLYVCPKRDLVVAFFGVQGLPTKAFGRKIALAFDEGKWGVTGANL